MLDLAKPSLTELSPRELTVLELVAEGCSNHEIAERLFVTVRTVESHVWAIMMKLCVARDDRMNRRVVLARLWFEWRQLAWPTTVSSSAPRSMHR